MEHRPQIVAAAIRSEENVVDVQIGGRRGHPRRPLSLRTLVRTEGRFVVGEDDDDRRHGGGGDGRGEDARQGLAKSFELPPTSLSEDSPCAPRMMKFGVSRRDHSGPRKADERSSPSGSATGSGRFAGPRRQPKRSAWAIQLQHRANAVTVPAASNCTQRFETKRPHIDRYGWRSGATASRRWFSAPRSWTTHDRACAKSGSLSVIAKCGLCSVGI